MSYKLCVGAELLRRICLIFFRIWDTFMHMNRKQKTEEKVFSFMEEHHMLKANDRIVAGISGGADSVCLLFVLLEYRKRMPISLAVVHVNHGIRAEAAEDARYVEELCRTCELPFYSFSVDVRELAEREKCSEEEAGRNARYQAFAQAAMDFHADKIAVAHNCNDRSETMLFHLFRGSGMKGLSSIRPVRENIIRPILCLERKEVEAYLSDRGISYCQDATNEKDDYTRNRIRHHILPYAEEEIVSGCVFHMAQTADMLSETEDYLEQQTETAMQDCVQGILPRDADGSAGDFEQFGQIEIDIAAFLRQHKVIRQRILYKAVISLTASGKDISYVHIRELLTLFTEQGNRSVNLPFGVVGRRQYEKVILECRRAGRKQPEKKGLCGKKIELPDCGSAFFCKIPLDENRELELQLLSSEIILTDFPTNQYTKWFDYDKIINYLELRTRRTGDYLTIAGKDGRLSHKSLKDYMITEKIPRNDREQIPLIADGQHVIWLIGYRISEYYKISGNTKNILQIQLIEKGFGSSETEEENG